MENMNERISIITICYNCKDDLQRTLQSVASQRYANKEYIVVDGGSTDGSCELLDAHAAQIDVLVSEPDDGIYDALNKGIQRATGEWILCLNAGDVFASDHVLQDVLGQGVPGDKSFLYSDFYLVQPDGTRQLRLTDRSRGELHHQNAIYRRRLHEQYGYYVVTHPYIVSDLLFFLAVPEQAFLKVDTPIALVKAGGVSDQQWCTEQAWAAKIIYGMESFASVFVKYLRAHVVLAFRRIFNKQKHGR